MNQLLKTTRKSGETTIYSPLLLMLQAEKLNIRGRGLSDYNYVDYYHDQNGNIYGFLDEVVITPDGGASWGEDNWEDDYINDHWGNEYPDDDYNGGWSGSNTSDQNVAKGEEFVDSLQKGDIDIQLTSEILDFASTTISITGLINTVAESIEQNIGLLGRIGSWLGAINTGYSFVSVVAGLTDGEISPKDWVNTASLCFSVGSFFYPPLGFVSIALTVAACGTPGDQGNQSLTEQRY